MASNLCNAAERITKKVIRGCEQGVNNCYTAGMEGLSVPYTSLRGTLVPDPWLGDLRKVSPRTV